MKKFLGLDLFFSGVERGRGPLLHEKTCMVWNLWNIISYLGVFELENPHFFNGIGYLFSYRFSIPGDILHAVQHLP